MAVLHITNGDGAANLIKASSVEGDVLPWRDPMHHGPFPADLELDAVSEVRADYLSGPGIDAGEARRQFRLRDDHLRGAGRYDEVVLWFEHDLLDQVQILQLLDWFGEAGFDLAKLSMICIDRFEGVEGFRGIGELTPEQCATLIDVRQPVSREQVQVAQAGWKAFRAPCPRDLEAFVGGDLRVLPFLDRALRRHLQEYPWLHDGLMQTERQLLQLVDGGTNAPGRLFVENMDFEDALFIGDWPTFRHLADLCDARTPLLSCAPDGVFRHPSEMDISREAFLAQRVSLTEAGKQVLAGEVSARYMMDRDRWLGGVHIRSGQPMWMWDGNAGRIELVP